MTMVAKLIFGILALVVIISVAISLSFWYFNQKGKRQHERELLRQEKRTELDEQLVEMAEQDTDIDRELER